MEYALVFLPLFGSFIAGFFGKLIGDRNSAIVTSAFVTISAVLSLIIFKEVALNNYDNNLIIATWINSGLVNVNWSIPLKFWSGV